MLFAGGTVGARLTAASQIPPCDKNNRTASPSGPLNRILTEPASPTASRLAVSPTGVLQVGPYLSTCPVSYGTHRDILPSPSATRIRVNPSAPTARSTAVRSSGS